MYQTWTEITSRFSAQVGYRMEKKQDLILTSVHMVGGFAGVCGHFGLQSTIGHLFDIETQDTHTDTDKHRAGSKGS